MVDRPLTLTVDQVRRRPARTVAAVLECAGNPEDPDKPTRIVSNAIWRGMPLAALLDEAGVAPGAGSVWLRGEDSGRYAGEDVPGYVKDLPLAKARDEDVLVAYEINGEPLPAEHGFPLRALVPGYYGTNSVKWLSSISVQAERPSGLFTSRLYNDEDEDGVRRPTWALAVNSRLVAPAEGEALAIGAHDVWGWAWGHEPVTEVAVSVDGGRSWRVADLERRSAGAPWQQFRTTWRPSEPGQYTILARATDSTGATQPHDVHLNQIQAVRVRVVDPGEGEPPRR